METAKLKKFAQFARRSLLEQVSAKLELVLADNSAARRESVEAIKKLEEAIKNHGKEQIIERVAYIWFNRFCALRFMDVNRYTRIGVVSPTEGQFQPEILMDAKMGHIDDEMVPEKIRQQIFALLDGKAPSHDPQGEAYRLLVVAACNFWNKAMPFLFQRIDDYTELLMPDDLLSGNSILAYTREAMTPDACEDVEVIGWLYQFYISEKKDEVFDGLKKNKKITPENIPPATQLFTPHWIVRYLVENSLGRLWLLNRPGSKLVEQMDYYIKPEQAESDFLRIAKPEEIKICDPACGSGHMLTYAFDLLYAIYEEEGVDPAEIPENILTNNLYGIEIDERAGELAAFALTMKARAKQRRFFNKGVKPNICVLENVHFDGNELKDYMDYVGRDLFTAPLQTTLRQFEEADNFGSLIRPDVTDVDGMRRILESKNVSGQLFISMTHQKVLQALRQADYLSPKYHVVIANPPYMGGKGMNGRMGAWIKDQYPDSKYDLFSAFIERGLELIKHRCFSAMVTMESWMFLSSFERMRTKILSQATILTLVHMPYSGKGGTSMGINFGTSAFVTLKDLKPDYKGHYCCVRYYETDDEGVPLEFPPRNERLSTVSSNEMRLIPGTPIAYWVSDKLRQAFASGIPLKKKGDTRQGMATSDNNRFLREWFEVDIERICFGAKTREDAKESGKKWFPYNKGGAYRRWYGNCEHVVNWENDGEEVLGYAASLYGSPTRTIKSISEYFKPSISWSKVTTGGFSMRYFKEGFIFDVAGCSVFSEIKRDLKTLLGFTNSPVAKSILASISPTLNFEAGQIALLPVFADLFDQDHHRTPEKLIDTSQVDWNFYETSWDFTGLPLLSSDYRQPTLKAIYQKLRAHWQEMTLEMQRLEEENNRIFIDAYGLQDELKPEVPLNEVTLNCNPHYRYGNDKSEDELAALLLADTMRELVSYAVGCMFGRYALDKPGLILANQGETLSDYLKRVPEPSFPADDDNVIPMLDVDWFTDDIAERFRKFLRVAFGDEHYEANLRFVEQGLNIKGKRNYGIRDYFLGEFYTDHVKRYKKRPIYWLFSSPKGSFNAMIYMHRYRPDTVSVVLNDYLREFRTKLTAHKNHLEAVSISTSSSPAEKTKALKEIEKITKMITEMEEYEREVLYPLATKQIEIDLDDGVKVNYPKFGAALKKIVGLDTKDE
jgi:type II restriction/modification system DNA methylase subunit YeeA